MTSYLRYKRELSIVQDADDIESWITVKGNHIPIRKGESKEEAVKSFLEKKGNSSSTKKEKKPMKKDWVQHVDPSHSWLQVPKKELEDLDIDITSSSYMNGEYAYLEEDVDFPNFIKKWKEKYNEEEPEYEMNINYSGPSKIRNYEPYKKTRKPEFKPILVIDKDTGNTKEFDDISEARKYYHEQVKENWGSDIRIMKQDIYTGDFIKWMN